MAWEAASSSLVSGFPRHFSHRMDIRCFLTGLNCYNLHRINYGGSDEREASCGDWLRSPGENPHRGDPGEAERDLPGVRRLGASDGFGPGGYREGGI